MKLVHCAKSVRIWSFSGPYFPVFWLCISPYSVGIRENISHSIECKPSRILKSHKQYLFSIKQDWYWSSSFILTGIRLAINGPSLERKSIPSYLFLKRNINHTINLTYGKLCSRPMDNIFEALDCYQSNKSSFITH